MKKTLSIALVVLAVCTFGSAHAALQNNGGGLIYDTDLDITWYYTIDRGNTDTCRWDSAMAWAAGLNAGGVSGWRLPTTPGITSGYTTEGELGHLFSELGGVPGSELLNYSPFEYRLYGAFWTNIEYAPDNNDVWVYTMLWGNQDHGVKYPWTNCWLQDVIAVHDGNVGADLGGIWYFQVFADHPTINDPPINAPYWGSGTMILDSTRAVIGGTAINDSGVTKMLTGGSLTIDSVGQVAGNITLSDDTTESLPHGKLDAGKTILTMVNSDPYYRGLFVAIKGGGTFTQADLAGTWYLQTYGDSPSTNAPYWAYGTIILDTTGAVTGGMATNNYGVTKTNTGGSFTIDSTGQVAGNIALSDGTTKSLPHGKLDAGKTILSMVTWDLDYRGLFVATKGGGTFSQADLAGTWYFKTFGDRPLPLPNPNDPYWGYGTMILDATGAVTGGTATNDRGVTKMLTGGSFSIDSAGQVAGTVTLSDNTTESFPHGKLDAGKNVLNLVTSDLNYIGLLVATKGGVTGTCLGDFASDGDVDGSDLATLIANSGLLDISTFAQNFGKNACQ